MNKYGQSHTELVEDDEQDVALTHHSKYVNLYQVDYNGSREYEVINNSTFEVEYRTDSYFFAVRRFQELSQD